MPYIDTQKEDSRFNRTVYVKDIFKINVIFILVRFARFMVMTKMFFSHLHAIIGSLISSVEIILKNILRQKVTIVVDHTVFVTDAIPSNNAKILSSWL